MASDKLTIINSALVQCGHDPVTDQDGSDEWIAASSAYERALPLILAKHTWGFQTVLGTLNRTGDSALPGYADMFARPADCLYLMNVWRTDLSTFIDTAPMNISDMGIRVPPLDYDVLDGVIHCSAPYGASVKYISSKNTEGRWPPLFVEAVTRQVESYLYRSLNEDDAASLGAMKIAEAELEGARVRNDQETPRRVAFRGKFRERRRSSYFG